MISLSAYFNGDSSRSDNSRGLRFVTQEVTPEQVGEFQRLNGAFGYLIFKENKIDDAEIPKEDIEDKNKTPSKRLRAALYVYAVQKGVKKESFEQFYRDQMELLIERVKAQLD